MADVKLCECGCGKPAPIATKHDPKMGYVKGKPRRFVHGHHARAALSGRIVNQNPTDPRTTRYRAQQMFRGTPCELEHISGCRGRVQVHHIDKDPFNNAPENLVPLCVGHHRLVENERIDLDNPIMPDFYTSPSGTRRYAHTMEKQKRKREREKMPKMPA